MPHEYRKYPNKKKSASKASATNKSSSKRSDTPKQRSPNARTVHIKPGKSVTTSSDDFLTKHLYWCEKCNIPLIAKTCHCKSESVKIPLQQPYDIRPALNADIELLNTLITERFGENITLPEIIVFNKAGGLDRNDLVIANGVRFAWLWFDPVSQKFNLELEAEALPFLIENVTKGVIDLETDSEELPTGGRLGGKKIRLKKIPEVSDGVVILKYKSKFGTGILKDGTVKVKELLSVTPKTLPNPIWQEAVEKNAFHLKNMERTAIREIRQNFALRENINCSFSGGKDSTAVWHIAQKAGVAQAFFIDTGLEFPETIQFVNESGVEIIQKAGDFWRAVEKAGPPGKDHRWCCKLLKLNPIKIHLDETGACVTVQGNRWYESWNRASLEAVTQNPANPLQINLSPIRSWRALDVFLYLWFRELSYNPLYERGYERIGCYLCPAMLESENTTLQKTHPEMAKRWETFLKKWAEERGLPPEFVSWGLWRWKELPPKMLELVREYGFDLSEKPVRRATPSSVAALMPDSAKSDVIDDSDDKWEKIRSEFPMIGELIYPDNAATSFSPESVLLAMDEYERSYRANVGRGVHRLTRIASQKYWHAHEKVSSLINGKSGTTVFVKNTTEAINMVAKGISWSCGDVIVTTILEHHSNLLVWRYLEDKMGVKVRVVAVNDDFIPDMKTFEGAMDDSVKLVAVTHASNVTGTVLEIEKISQLCQKHNAMLLVDAAQSVPHMKVDAEKLGADFICFSGHKMCGPTGTGVLWMKNQNLEPLLYGGGMVSSVGDYEFEVAEGFYKYEAGTPNISGGIGLGEAAAYLENIGMDKIMEHESELATRLIDKLSKIPSVKVYAPKLSKDRIGVVSFTIDGVSPNQAAAYLDDEFGIMVRSGMHCAEPLMRHIGCLEGTIRASLSFYNTKSEIDTLAAAVREMTE